MSNANRRSNARRTIFGLACLCVLGLAAFLGSGASSAGAVAACSNEALRAEQGSAFLPDCRAFEQVSPVDKNGIDVLADSTRVRSATDGEAAMFASLSGYGDVEGTGLTAEYISVRGAGGWATHGITPVQQPNSFFETANTLRGIGYRATMSPDLSKGVFMAKSPLTADANTEKAANLYLREGLRGPGPISSTLLTGATTPQAAKEGNAPNDAAATADLSHVLFESKRNLTADAVSAALSTSQPKLYEWVEGEERLVGQVPTGGATECAGAACAPSVSQAGSGALRGQYTDRTLSTDGSRAVFTAPPFSGDQWEGVLYLRDDQGTASTADDTTVQVNASERTDCNESPGSCTGTPEPDPAGAKPARFWAASSAETEIFFTTAEQLTDDDRNGVTDLYRYDLEAPAGERLTRLSVDHEPADGDGANVNGVIGASQSGDYVYFVASGQLAAGKPPSGAPRIFVWHDGTVAEVGGLFPAEASRLTGAGGWSFSQGARLTPDGTHLIFVSQGSDELTGYDHGDSCTSLTDPACTEAYLYDATANGGEGQLACASCNPSSAAATADANFNSTYAQGSSAHSAYRNRALTDEGRYVFFTSGEALVPQDTNGVDDAYEYDAQTGEVHLISSGTDPAPSFFMDASPDGRDVFFLTRQRLVGWDADNSVDLYDARAEGGFPEPPPSAAACREDSCQGAQAQAPAAIAAGSANLRGAGNARLARPCPRGRHRVRRGGKSRCVKRHYHRKHRSHNRANHNRRASR